VSRFILLGSHLTPLLSSYHQLQIYLHILKLILNLCGRLLFIEMLRFVVVFTICLFLFTWWSGSLFCASNTEDSNQCLLPCSANLSVLFVIYLCFTGPCCASVWVSYIYVLLVHAVQVCECHIFMFYWSMLCKCMSVIYLCFTGPCCASVCHIFVFYWSVLCKCVSYICVLLVRAVQVCECHIFVFYWSVLCKCVSVIYLCFTGPCCASIWVSYICVLLVCAVQVCECHIFVFYWSLLCKCMSVIYLCFTGPCCASVWVSYICVLLVHAVQVCECHIYHGFLVLAVWVCDCSLNRSILIDFHNTLILVKAYELYCIA
jgi:hypothetical protein